MTQHTCQRAIHPGEMLKEEIEYRQIKQSKLAEQMGISYKILNDILNCRRTISGTTAMLFEACLGISASLIMRMQLDYTMQTLKEDKSLIQRLMNIQRIASVL